MKASTLTEKFSSAMASYQDFVSWVASSCSLLQFERHLQVFGLQSKLTFVWNIGCRHDNVSIIFLQFFINNFKYNKIEHLDSSYTLQRCILDLINSL